MQRVCLGRMLVGKLDRVLRGESLVGISRCSKIQTKVGNMFKIKCKKLNQPISSNSTNNLINSNMYLINPSINN